MTFRRAIVAVVAALHFWTAPVQSPPCHVRLGRRRRRQQLVDRGELVGDVAPSISGVDSLEFPSGAARRTNTNDFVGAIFQSITVPTSVLFDANCGYSFNGNALTLTGSLVLGCGSAVNVAMTVSGSVSVSGFLTSTINAPIIGAGGTTVSSVGTGGLRLLPGSILGNVVLNGGSLLGDGAVGTLTTVSGTISLGEVNAGSFGEVGVLRTGSLNIRPGDSYQATIAG